MLSISSFLFVLFLFNTYFSYIVVVLFFVLVFICVWIFRPSWQNCLCCPDLEIPLQSSKPVMRRRREVCQRRSEEPPKKSWERTHEKCLLFFFGGWIISIEMFNSFHIRERTRFTSVEIPALNRSRRSREYSRLPRSLQNESGFRLILTPQRWAVRIETVWQVWGQSKSLLLVCSCAHHRCLPRAVTSDRKATGNTGSRP